MYIQFTTNAYKKVNLIWYVQKTIKTEPTLLLLDELKMYPTDHQLLLLKEKERERLCGVHTACKY